MGWTKCYTAPYYKWQQHKRVVDRKKCLDDLFTWGKRDDQGKLTASFQVVKSAMVGSVWYGAVRRLDGNVIAVVCLTCGKSRYDGTIWGYKEIDESMCPYYYDCPVSILDLLTPTDDQMALEWRAQCRKHKDERTAKRQAIEAMDVPKGIIISYRGGWVVTSDDYVAKHHYSGIRYTRIDKRTALNRFIVSFGTKEQREAWKGKPAD